MEAVNPAVIPRNHFVQAVIDSAVQHQDFGPFTGAGRGDLLALC